MNNFSDLKTSSSTEQDMPIAQLTVYADEDGLIYFACDWEDNPTALSSIADIFYKLDRQDLIAEILQDLRSQCVLEDREADYNKIYNLFSNLKALKESMDELSSDNIVVNPIDATTF